MFFSSKYAIIDNKYLCAVFDNGYFKNKSYYLHIILPEVMRYDNWLVKENICYAGAVYDAWLLFGL